MQFLGNSWDYVTNGPATVVGNHATALAGVAAARGGNGIGVTGAAPFAQIASVRGSPGGTVAQLPSADPILAAAILHRNDVIKIRNHSYFSGTEFIHMPQRDAAIAASAAAGVINVFSAARSVDKLAQSTYQDHL